MSVTINLEQAKKILEYFGGEDTLVTIERSKEGHSGDGNYIHCTEYPEEGYEFLGTEPN